jgi:outer membrane autotransporter protein
MGLGPFGGLVAQSVATVAPGNSVGTLQVNGNVQLLAGSTYQAEITSAAADLIDATGTAQIAGTLSVVNLGGTYTLGTSYVIVNAAGGRTGTFDATSGLNSFGPRLRARVVYTPTQVQLLMDPNLLSDLACSDPTRNQASFIAAFDDAVQNGGYDPQTLAAIYELDPAGVCGAVDRLSGGVYPALASVALEEERLLREAAVDRLRFAQDAEAVGTGAWAQLVGSWGHVNGDGTGFDVDHDREGAIFGVDTGGAGWRVGIYGHHVETELDADALGSEAHLERNGAGAYAGFASGSFRARLGASYSDLEFSTTRAIAFPGFGASAQGAGDGSMIQGFGEVAYRFDVGSETFLEPFADLALASLDLDAVDETGSAASQLRVAEQEHDVGRAIAGLRGDAAIQRGSTRLRLGIDAGLQHNFGDRSIAALIALDGAPQHPFTVRAAEIEPWAFVGGGRVAIDFGSNVTATLSYRGVLAGTRNDPAAAGTLSVRF